MFGPILAVLLCAAPGTPADPVLDPDKVAELQKFTQELRPGISPPVARRLSRIALHVGLRQDIDPYLLLSIARVESNVEPGILACWQKRNAPPGALTCDHGLMQINDIWVKTWKLDAFKLMTDDYLNVWVAARLLVQLRKEFGSEPTWYGRYHSNIPWRRDRWEKRLHDFYSPPRESSETETMSTETIIRTDSTQTCVNP